MKNTITLLFLIISLSLNAQNQTRDVLYLKSGSVIKGTITEMNPNTGIKIKTADGSLFVYKMDEILKTEKEEFTGKELNNNNLSESVTNDDISSYFSSYFKNDYPALNLIEAKKTNGIKRDFFGQEVYQIEYELIIEIMQKIFPRPCCFVEGKFDAGKFWYETESNYSGAKVLNKGERIISKGTINFEKTDNGWRVKSFNNLNYSKVASNYTSPEMAQKQAQEKAIATENIKKELDWRSKDIEPIKFKPQYFKLQNIPYFNYGYSKYHIATTPSYKGRNDLAAKIQTAFFEALSSTNRQNSDSIEEFSNSQNQANYTFIISSVDFEFKETGYQCSINVTGSAKGTFNDPNTYPFNYAINLPAKSNGYKKNMSKAEAFNLALENFKKAVRGMVYKYEPIQIDFLRIEIDKKGKVDQIVFKKPEHFINASKMKFILMKPSDLLVEDGQFKIKGKIGDCVFKGEIIGDEIICDVSGGKNKKAIANYINTNEQLIGISSF